MARRIVISLIALLAVTGPAIATIQPCLIGMPNLCFVGCPTPYQGTCGINACWITPLPIPACRPNPCQPCGSAMGTSVLMVNSTQIMPGCGGMGIQTSAIMSSHLGCGINQMTCGINMPGMPPIALGFNLP